MLEDLRVAAPKLTLATIPVEVGTPAELDRALEALERRGADAMFLGPEAFITTQRQRILDVALARRIPATSALAVFADAGALLTYSPHGLSLAERAVAFADRILRGARPADLPVEQPARFDLIVDAMTARALGIALPPALLLQATRVIE